MAKTQKGLGMGLSVLLQETEKEYANNFMPETASQEQDNGGDKVYELKLSEVHANPNQPRKVFDEQALRELSDSIQKHGVIQPIVVNRDSMGYMIIAGERRYRACTLAGLDTIPAIVKNYDERQVKEVSLIENLQREDLNPIEAALAMRQLMEDYGLTQEVLSERIGKSRSAVANKLRLLTLSQEVIKLIANNKLSEGHARALITLPQDEQKKLAERAANEGLSVRDVEQAVRDYFNPPEDLKKAKKEKQLAQMSVELKDLVARMQVGFGTKVGAIGNDHKGRIYIDYYTRDDLDRIADILDLVENNKL